MRENPLARPLSDQLLPPDQLVPDPDEAPTDAVGHTWVFALTALERQRIAEYHSAYRFTADLALKVTLGEISRVEHQHTIRLASLERPMPLQQQALWNEQAALDWFVRLAQEEPEANVRTGFEYIVLEVLEHAFQVAEALRSLGGGAEHAIDHSLLLRGRPLDEQYLTAFDVMKAPYDHLSVDPVTKADIRIGAAITRALAETYQQLIALVNGNSQRAEKQSLMATLARVARVKEIHTAFLESFIDPWEPILESLVAGEYTESLFYRRALTAESRPARVDLFRSHLADEIGHLTLLSEELSRRERRDLASLLEAIDRPPGPSRPASEFVPHLLETQIARRSKGKSYVDIGKTLEAYS